uniref:Ricin B lectin domain-containing protein n=1 Tax=Helicotheca tamesis TaxID=374047 RepID=A0A7S2HML1_9STRA|mmetsp:Transcript_19340/g.26553  ORF Transcript_19340/g.26553 Transcript_19340/m.26553 type:complete len:248 (+) Transcript_19340:79-822(+)
MKSVLVLFTATFVVDCVFSINSITQNLREKTKEASEAVTGRDLWGTSKHYSHKSSASGKKSKSSSSGKKSNEKEEKHESSGHSLLKPFTCPGLCASSVFDAFYSYDQVVELVTCDECDPNQRWKIHTVKEGYVQIKNVGTGLCIQPLPDEDFCDETNELELELIPCDILKGAPTEQSLFLRQGSSFINVYCTFLSGGPSYLNGFGSEECDGGPGLNVFLSDSEQLLLQDATWLVEDCPPDACASMWY